MESQKFTMLHEIDVLRSTPSTIKVKVLKVWSVKDNIKPNQDFLMEMVFMDELVMFSFYHLCIVFFVSVFMDHNFLFCFFKNPGESNAVYCIQSRYLPF